MDIDKSNVHGSVESISSSQELAKPSRRKILCAAAAIPCLKPKAAFLYGYDDEGNAAFYLCQRYGLETVMEAKPPYEYGYDEGDDEGGDEEEREEDEDAEGETFDVLAALREVAQRFAP